MNPSAPKPTLEQAQEILQKVYGYSQFRPGQQAIIGDLLSGRDVVGILPTGGGKSIGYQIPALLLPGLTLVISPLISLMKDQVDALTEMNVPATYLNSSISLTESRERLSLLRSGKIKLLYIAPERLDSDFFSSFLQDIPVSFVAVDEAHCISQWGHDFRPSYFRIQTFINSLPIRPLVAAFTATATEKVREDIVHNLGLTSPAVHMTGFNRPNLFFDVLNARPSERADYIVQYLRAREGESGVIYALTRREVEELTLKLQAGGISAIGYHAGMSDVDRSHNQEMFVYDRVQVIVATNAFGMGIDKPDVRFVIHNGAPKNLEAYYQEAGRAGRDGEAAECLLLYSPGDIVLQRKLIEQSDNPDQQVRDIEKLQAIANYAYTSGCLRRALLAYFGEVQEEDCGYCGNCRRKKGVQVEVTRECQILLSLMRRTRCRFGATLIAKTVAGDRGRKLTEYRLVEDKTYGMLKGQWTAAQLVDLLRRLTHDGYLVEDETYHSLQPTAKGDMVLASKQKVFMPAQSIKPKETSRKRGARAGAIREMARSTGEETLSGDKSKALFAQLRELRTDISRELGVPPYIVFTDASLLDMCRRMPVTREQFLHISGVGEIKYQRYGERFMQIVRAYAQEDVSAPTVDALMREPTQLSLIQEPTTTDPILEEATAEQQSDTQLRQERFEPQEAALRILNANRSLFRALTGLPEAALDEAFERLFAKPLE